MITSGDDKNLRLIMKATSGPSEDALLKHIRIQIMDVTSWQRRQAKLDFSVAGVCGRFVSFSVTNAHVCNCKPVFYITGTIRLPKLSPNELFVLIQYDPTKETGSVLTTPKALSDADFPYDVVL